jgi:hypothetical protein
MLLCKLFIKRLAMNLSIGIEYSCLRDLDLYSSPECKGLATQAARDRHLHLVSTQVENNAVRICLRGDDYPAWLNLEDTQYLVPTQAWVRSPVLSRAEIEARIPAIIEFARSAMAVPNQYLWGGTVAPNYDCSGLMQAAFGSQGIWLPRDSYQQEIFTHRIEIDRLLPGDLVFFGTPTKTDHVALHLGDLFYIHSSGKEIGRNGIGIDLLDGQADDPISLKYFSRFRCGGRVMYGYEGNFGS